MAFSNKWFFGGISLLLLTGTFLISQRVAHTEDKVLNPPPGIWIAHPGDGKLVCPGFTKAVPAPPPSKVTITLLENGDKIKFDSPEGKGILTRDMKGPEGGHYQGPVTGKEGSINLDLLFTEIKGKSQMVGEMHRKPAKGCNFNRSLFMEWSRATTKIHYINK